MLVPQMQVPVWVLVTLLLIQVTTNAPVKAVEDDLHIWAPASHVVETW